MNEGMQVPRGSRGDDLRASTLPVPHTTVAFSEVAVWCIGQDLCSWAVPAEDFCKLPEGDTE